LRLQSGQGFASGHGAQANARQWTQACTYPSANGAHAVDANFAEHG
jgi:hypothetical protein